MKSTLSKFLSLLLALATALPSPAWALRQSQPANTGGLEEIQGALTAGLEEVPLQQKLPFDSVEVAPATGVPAQSAEPILLAVGAGVARRFGESIDAAKAAGTVPQDAPRNKLIYPVGPEKHPAAAIPVHQAHDLGMDVLAVIGPPARQGDLVRKVLDEAAGKQITYAVQGDPLGTGHAVYTGLAAFKGPASLDRPIVIMMADQPLLGYALAGLLDFALAQNADIVVSGSRFSDPKGKGRVVVRRGTGEVAAIIEQADIDAMQAGQTFESYTREELDANPLGNVSLYYFRSARLLLQLLAPVMPNPKKKEYYVTDVVANAAARAGLNMRLYEVAPLLQADLTTLANVPEVEAALAKLEGETVAGMEESGGALTAEQYAKKVLDGIGSGRFQQVRFILRREIPWQGGPLPTRFRAPEPGAKYRVIVERLPDEPGVAPAEDEITRLYSPGDVDFQTALKEVSWLTQESNAHGGPDQWMVSGLVRFYEGSPDGVPTLTVANARVNPYSASVVGLEEYDRRELLRRGRDAAAAGALAWLAPISDLLAQEPRVVEGAFKPLAEELGKEREIALVVWDPAELPRRPELFGKATRAGATTVWISGHGFLQLTPREQQAVLSQASAAGLRTLGFVDGNYDWAQQRAYVEGHYNRLTGVLLARDLGKLRVAFGTDIEPYTRPRETGWNGDLTAYADLLEKVIRPKIEAFAKQRPNRMAGSWLTRFEPFWYRNGNRTEEGHTLRGLRELPKTVRAVMSYRDTAPELIAISADARLSAQRAKDEKFQLGAETLPAGEVGGDRVTFAGQEGEIPGTLLDVVKALPKEDRTRLDGVFIHFRGPGEADKALDAWLKARPAPPAPPEPKQPPAAGEVKLADKSLLITDTRLSGRLEGAPAGARVVGLLRTDNYYWQPSIGASVAVGPDGAFTLETAFNPPGRPGWRGASEVVILVFGSAEEVKTFVTSYPAETGLRAVPGRERIKPRPVRMIRILKGRDPEVSWNTLQPVLTPQGGWVLGPGYAVGFQLAAVSPEQALAGLEEATTRRDFLGQTGRGLATAAALAATTFFGPAFVDPALGQQVRPPAQAVSVIPGLKLKGFGLETPAGRGGEIVRVTSLEDSGPGTLRDAVQKKGPRVIVFETSGTITLKKPLAIREPFLTIAGQTAPAGGITLRGAGLTVQTHDVLVQHLRIRVGDDDIGLRGDLRDAVQIYGPADPRAPEGVTGAKDVVFDSCSFSWGIDELVGLQFAPENITFYRCIFSEALRHAGHPKDDGEKGGHSKGLLIAESCKSILVVGCLFAHSYDRNPAFIKKGAQGILFLNNVAYNSGRSRFVDIGSTDQAGWWKPETYSAQITAAVKSNVFIAGPDAQALVVGVGVVGNKLDPKTQVFVTGNKLVGIRGGEYATDASFNPRVTQEPDWVAVLPSIPAAQVEAWVLASAGARPANRDAVDARIVKEVTDRTGGIIDSPKERGGWPEIPVKKAGFAAPANPKAPAGAGYTQLEKTLHDLAKQLEPAKAGLEESEAEVQQLASEMVAAAAAGRVTISRDDAAELIREFRRQGLAPVALLSAAEARIIYKYPPAVAVEAAYLTGVEVGEGHRPHAITRILDWRKQLLRLGILDEGNPTAVRNAMERLLRLAAPGRDEPYRLKFGNLLNALKETRSLDEVETLVPVAREFTDLEGEGRRTPAVRGSLYRSEQAALKRVLAAREGSPLNAARARGILREAISMRAASVKIQVHLWSVRRENPFPNNPLAEQGRAAQVEIFVVDAVRIHAREGNQGKVQAMVAQAQGPDSKFKDVPIQVLGMDGIQPFSIVVLEGDDAPEGLGENVAVVDLSTMESPSLAAVLTEALRQWTGWTIGEAFLIQKLRDGRLAIYV